MRDTLVQAVVGVDALADATGLKYPDVEPQVLGYRSARGLVQLRTVLSLMDASAESPPEMRTRLLLIAAGFPRPRTQIIVCLRSLGEPRS